MPEYFPTPEETAECGYCLHRDNGGEFMREDAFGEWSECPECGGVDETPPYLDQEDIAREAAQIKLGITEDEWNERKINEAAELMRKTRKRLRGSSTGENNT